MIIWYTFAYYFSLLIEYNSFRHNCQPETQNAYKSGWACCCCFSKMFSLIFRNNNIGLFCFLILMGCWIKISFDQKYHLLTGALQARLERWLTNADLHVKNKMRLYWIFAYNFHSKFRPQRCEDDGLLCSYFSRGFLQMKNVILILSIQKYKLKSTLIYRNLA